jgi:hypothetical protein
MSEDLIARYLSELRTSLRTRDADLVLAEAEDHLRESVAAGLAMGMTEVEAQEAAISAFGSVRAVVRAHNRRSRQVLADLVLADLVLAGLKLGSAGMFAVAASGVVALVMNHVFGRSFVGGTHGSGDAFTRAQCQHWMAIWSGARTCGQAAMLEASSDAVSLRIIAGGLGGAILLAGYLLAARYWRRGVPVLPRAFVPLAAAAAFTTGALALVVGTFTGAPFAAPAGPGTYLSGALGAAAAATAFAARARHVLHPARR